MTADTPAGREARFAWALLTPLVIVLIVVAVGPLVATVSESFYRHDLQMPWLGRPRIGPANYVTAAGDPRLISALAHTFVIGMQTMEVRHVPFSNTSTAVSSFVWMLALSYLYLEVTTDERAMGVFIVPILVGLQTIPAINPGIETNSVAVIDVLSDASLDPRRRIQKIDEMIAALSELPGARSAAAALRIPLRGGGDSFGIGIEGEGDADRTFTYFRMVSPRYFETMGIRLLEGRTFDVSDLAPRADSSAREIPVVINAALAAKYFPGQNPIGRRLTGGLSVPQRIIGIVADVAEANLTDGPEPTRYYMHAQAWFGKGGVLVIRTDRPEDAATLLGEARKTVERVAPEFAVQGTTTMSRVLDAAVGPARQVMSLLSLLSGLALVLGAVGIYGVIAHFAARRKRDWAIQVALGLPGSRVVTHVVRQGAVLAGIGKQAQRYRYLAYSAVPELIDQSLIGCRYILAAIVKGDAARAREITEELIRRSWKTVGPVVDGMLAQKQTGT